MKNTLKICLALTLLSATSCALPRPSAGPGFIYTNITEGVFANNAVEEKKQGELCNSNILGIASTGDSSIESVKRKAMIKNVSSIDRTYEGILGVYAKSCTIIKGN